MLFRARTAIGAVLVSVMALVAVPAGRSVELAEARPAARTVTIPRTLTRTTRMAPPKASARVELGLRPTHIAFSWRGPEGTGVRFRTIASDGDTSRWRRAPIDHSLEDARRRFTAVIGVDRPQAIEWRPAARRGAMSDVTLDQINTLDGPEERVELTAADTSEASAGAPKIVTRAEWGADESLKRTSGGCRRDFFPVQQLFVHHTAGSNNVSDPKATMRAIYWFHTARRGWCDIGYNFVVDRKGTIYEGRWARRYKPWEIHSSENAKGRAVTGAHVSGFNSGSVGVSLMGNFEHSPLPPAMRRGLARLLAWEVDHHGLKPKGTHLYRNPDTGASRKLPYIAGHRDAGQTSCPGRYVYAALPGIRRDVKAVIGAGKTNTSMTFPFEPTQVTYGTPLTLSGTVSDAQGGPVSGVPVRLWRKSSEESWRVAATASSGTDGSFSFTLSAESNMTVTAVYNGNAATWGSQSGDVKVKVRPSVSIAPQGASPGSDGVYVYPAGTTSVTLAGNVAPPHEGRDATVRVSQLQPDGTYAEIAAGGAALDANGAYSFTYGPVTSGTYSAQAWLPRHSDHAKGISEVVYFRI